MKTKRLLITSCSVVLLFTGFSVLTRATSKPDLVVSELSVRRIQPSAVPLRVEVKLSVNNKGEATGATNFVTRLSYRLAPSTTWQTLNDWTCGATSHNGGAIWTKTFDFQDGGTYYFKAEVDAGKQVAELSESNNTKTVTMHFDAGTPDLVPQNLSASTTSVTYSGTWNVRVGFDVANIGTGKALGSFVTVLWVSKNGGSYAELGRYTKSNMEAGHSSHVIKTASFTGVTSLKFKVAVDDTHAVHETSEANNATTSQTLKR